MEYRNLGRSGLKVSPLCLGTMMFGAWGNPDHDDSIRTIHRAIDAGINFIATANVYSAGECEEIIGKAIAGRREEVVLATKVFGAMGDGPNQRGLSRKTIEEQVDHSLRRLGTDVIDLYQIHRPDPTTPWDETLRALDDLVRKGKVRYIGASTNHYASTSVWQQKLETWQLVESLWVSERQGLERFISLQPPYSMLRRSMEDDHFPMTRHFGIGNIVWSPLEGGWLTGKYRRDAENPKDSVRAEKWVGDTADPKFEQRLDVVEELLPMAEARGMSLARFATAWTLLNPDVTSVIIGPRTLGQLEDSLEALEVTISEEEKARIDELVPPGTSVL
ncbi:MAG: aldo/keto reductase, partial [Acidobacteriota bacterium]